MTDADGRFRLSGIGRDRIIDIEVEGPTIQSATIHVMTRTGKAVSSPPGTFGGQTIYPASFEHFIPPGRALTGIVRDKKTKQPLAGVPVCGQDTNTRTTTDAQGRYTLFGFPKSKSYGLMVLAGEKVPYFVTCMQVPDTAGLEPVEADVECRAGNSDAVETDRQGDGQAGARTRKSSTSRSIPTRTLAKFRAIPRFEVPGLITPAVRQDDGTYLIGVLPGPGGVFVRMPQGVYRPACVDPGKFFKVKASTNPKEQQTAALRRHQHDFHGRGRGMGRDAAVSVQRDRAGEPAGRFRAFHRGSHSRTRFRSARCVCSARTARPSPTWWPRAMEPNRARHAGR